jgi:hypothetical protein
LPVVQFRPRLQKKTMKRPSKTAGISRIKPPERHNPGFMVRARAKARLNP